jgi:hypothetical protein
MFLERAQLKIIPAGKSQQTSPSFRPQGAWIVFRSSPTGHTPHPTTDGYPTSRGTPRGVNDLDRDADAFFYAMHTYKPLVITRALDYLRPNDSRSMGHHESSGSLLDMDPTFCILNSYGARFIVRQDHLGFRNDKPVKRCRLYMHGLRHRM